MDFERIKLKLNALLDAGKKAELRGALNMLNEVDIADYLETLDNDKMLMVFRDRGQSLIKNSAFLVRDVFSRKLHCQRYPLADLFCSLIAQRCQGDLGTVSIAVFSTNKTFFHHSGKTAGDIGLISAAKLAKLSRSQTLRLVQQHHKIHCVRSFQIILPHFLGSQLVPAAGHFKQGKGKPPETINHIFIPRFIISATIIHAVC